MYCVYTDKEVPKSEGNFDHIIPLSLGGRNEFCVWADSKFNSDVGGKIDGAIANDPLVMFARREADARGHSGAEPIPMMKKSEFEGRPVQVSFEKEAVKIWDAKSNSYLDDASVVGKPIKSHFSLDRFASIRFAAKVALGGAYFVYGEAIFKATDCDELRRLITLDVEAAKGDPDILASKVTICDRFHPDVLVDANAGAYKAFCEFSKRSIFLAVPHDQSVSFHVGVLGMHLCSIICPADTSGLPNDAELHDIGHAILLKPGDFERLSLRQLAGRCYQSRTGQEPASPVRE